MLMNFKLTRKQMNKTSVNTGDENTGTLQHATNAHNPPALHKENF